MDGRSRVQHWVSHDLKRGGRLGHDQRLVPVDTDLWLRILREDRRSANNNRQGHDRQYRCDSTAIGRIEHTHPRLTKLSGTVSFKRSAGQTLARLRTIHFIQWISTVRISTFCGEFCDFVDTKASPGIRLISVVVSFSGPSHAITHTRMQYPASLSRPIGMLEAIRRGGSDGP